MQKLKNHFLKLGPRRFVWGAVFILIVLDILNSIYLRLYWGFRGMSQVLVKYLANSQGLEFSQLEKQTILEVHNLVDNAFYFLLFIILINNLFFYIFYCLKKLWAQGYVLFYAFSNSILAITFIIEGPILGWSWYIYNVITMFLYFYLYMGIKTLKNETTDFIPECEKKGQ